MSCRICRIKRRQTGKFEAPVWQSEKTTARLRATGRCLKFALGSPHLTAVLIVLLVSPVVPDILGLSWVFLKIGGYLLGVPIIKIIVFGVYIGVSLIGETTN